MGKRSKGVTIFCWILIIYALLFILFDLYILVRAHFSLPYLLKAIYTCSRVLIASCFEIVIAILLLRLNNVARKIFIIYALILTILTIYTSISYSQHTVPQLIEKSNQEQIKICKQKGEIPRLPSATVQFIVFCTFFNLARLTWITIYVIGISLFTRPKVIEQFK